MKGWKTIIANILIAITGFIGGEQIVATLGAEWVALIIAGINLVLRYLTTSPIGKPS